MVLFSRGAVHQRLCLFVFVFWRCYLCCYTKRANQKIQDRLLLPWLSWCAGPGHMLCSFSLLGVVFVLQPELVSVFVRLSSVVSSSKLSSLARPGRCAWANAVAEEIARFRNLADHPVLLEVWQA
jgi:hypothetical protein